MDTRTVEQIEDWDSRPFSGGYAGLHELADAQFSGAVSAGRTWLFMLNGRTVGVFEGTIEDYEDRDGTTYRAPDPALPLLFTMLELGGETQAKYYTNDTALSEAGATLADAGFTGYIELSENVLSGDYYSVYYGGRSMNAAFVGASERLLTGDEAFERADDEVGIYEVVAVDLELVDLPEVDEPEPEPTPVAADEPEESAEPDPEPEPEPEPESEPRPADDPLDSPASGPAGADDEPTVAEVASEPEPEPDRSEPEQVSRPEQPPAADAPERGTEAVDAGASDLEGRRGPAGGEGPPEGRGAGRRADDDVFSEEAQWRETKSIPSIDPDRTESSGSAGRGAAAQQAAQARRARSRSESENGSDRDERRRREPAHRRAKRVQPDSAAGRAEPSDEAKAALRKHKEEIERLRGKVSALEEEREEFEAERAKLEGEIERLQSELEEARANAAAAAGSGGSAAPTGEQLTPEAALDGTNLFVRYGSKGKPTLETAHSGRADTDEVNANLKLEHHTQFDAETVSVEGRSFVEFLHDSIEYSFVEWAVRELLYEIRDTGHTGGLREVYDALPRVDRAELGGTVTVTTMADGEAQEREQAFDVILRDRMGNPLLVANLNDSRDPATSEVMSSLVESSSAVCESHEELGGAFYVTASFFEPGALETASEATSGGLLSREKKDSYVKFARKRGYHLCLVETRAGEFHVNVPEL